MARIDEFQQRLKKVAVVTLAVIIVGGLYIGITLSFTFKSTTWPRSKAVVTITERERQIVQQAIKRHGDYPIVIEREQIVMERHGKQIRLGRECGI